MARDAAPVSCAFGARAVLTSVQILASHMRGARQRPTRKFEVDARTRQSVHHMRVAARRLRSALDPIEPCFPARRLAVWNKEIRLARRALGDARDADVQIGFLEGFLKDLRTARHRPGIEHLLLRLLRRRRKLQKNVVEAVDRLRRRHVLDQLAAAAKSLARYGGGGEAGAEKSLRTQARKVIRRQLKAFLALEPCVGHPDEIARHHAMRIAAKRLRYAMDVYVPLYGEALTPFIEAAKDVQSRLGEIHDCDVWVEWLPRFIEKERRRAERHSSKPGPEKIEPGLRHLQADRRRLRARRFRAFAAFWKKLRNARGWERLEEVLKEGTP
jgi:CHAD domain-containing protein